MISARALTPNTARRRSWIAAGPSSLRMCDFLLGSRADLRDALTVDMDARRIA
jgi:hypothetical protein